MVDIISNTFLNIGAAKENFSSKNCTQKMVENELTTWFGNARDRGNTGRRQQTQVQAIVPQLQADAVIPPLPLQAAAPPEQIAAPQEQVIP